jgi:hypothetical protein
MKRNSVASWIAGIFGLELDVELSEIVEEEEKERAEEEKIKDLLIKKKAIMEKISNGLANVSEISQIYTARNMLDMIFGKGGLIKLNEKLKNLDEKLKDENKKELEELKKDKAELRKEGLDIAYGIEQRIDKIHEEMKGLFNLFEDRINEENRILKDRETFGKLLQNTMEGMAKLSELNQLIGEVRKDLTMHEHDILKKEWQARIMRKFDELNELSMSARERKELLSHIRKHLTNPIKARYKEDAGWVNELEMKLEKHEHMKKSYEWENKLERAIWDLSEEVRKERMIQQHMERALLMMEKEMERFRMALESKSARLAA